MTTPTSTQLCGDQQAERGMHSFDDINITEPWTSSQG